MNPQEKFLYEHLDEEIKPYIGGATMSFKQNLGLVQDYLKTIYGDRGDWILNLDRYDQYMQLHPEIEGANSITSIEDIPEIGETELRRWLDYEERDTKLIDELLKNFDMVSNRKDLSDEDYSSNLQHCLELLGVLPEFSEEFMKAGLKPLYEWIVNCDEITDSFLNALENRFQTDRNLPGTFFMLAKILSNICTPGMMFNYDAVSIVTQQPRRFYYRGENAFYGSSKAGLFRNGNRSEEQKLIDALRQNECGFFLDNFESVRQWKIGNGTVRYGALMQHYGLKTQFMDITSDLKVALFFACCRPLEDDSEKWRPLRKEEFEEADSRLSVAARGGDSRYALIYRSRTEIEYMRYFLGRERKAMVEYPFAEGYKEDISGEIIPIGYQPFMRGSVQHGYTMLVDEDYDMYKDLRLGKFKICLNEELCNWIYEEMDCGNKVYPNNDIPHIQQYISRINDTRDFSETNVKAFCQSTKTDYKRLKAYLKHHGYTVKNKTYLISHKEIESINKKYSVEIAEQRMAFVPKMSPIIVMTGDTVEN